MERPHALVLPVPGQGHINPMLSFSLQLAVRSGFVITFVSTEASHKRMLESNQSQQQSISSSEGGEIDIRFVSIPDGTEEPPLGQEKGQQLQVPFSRIRAVLDGVAAQQGLLEDMVTRSRATPHPITCLVSDSFFPWAQAMANKLGIKNAAFWTSCAATFATAMEVRSGRLSAADDAAVREVTAGLAIPSSEVLSRFGIQDPERAEWFKRTVATLPEAACVVVNTFQELEAPSLRAAVAAAGCGIAIRCVGPLLPPATVSIRGASLFPEQRSTCVDWLEQQAPGSVLYISFGSVVSLSPQQHEELALGVELSERPFLWAARDGPSLLPEGFVDRTRGRGLVVNWAPQLQVLGHAAVGGFLTHCGWNSTVESIHMGVPMLCHPVSADQHFNALLITRCWGVGMEMRKDEQLGGLFARSEVQTAVAALMSSQELHSKAATWKASAHRAVAESGSSWSSFTQVIDDLGST